MHVPEVDCQLKKRVAEPRIELGETVEVLFGDPDSLSEVLSHGQCGNTICNTYSIAPRS